MVNTFIATIPMYEKVIVWGFMDFSYITTRKTTKREILHSLESVDSKKWTIGIEQGKRGYQHYQIRYEASGDKDEAWNRVKSFIPTAHIELANDSERAWKYERKDGHYWCSWDTIEVRAQRYGQLRPFQKAVLKALRNQNDREILVWYDQEGKMGKSWLTGHLWENGQACVVPATINEPKAIIQYVASTYDKEPIVIIDIPRAGKWNNALYEAIEVIKDGLVYDTRYSGRMKNIKGIKILVMTNSYPKVDKLSKDRWKVIMEYYGEVLIEHPQPRARAPSS